MSRLVGGLGFKVTAGHFDCNKPNSIKEESRVSLSLCNWIVF